MPAKKLLSDIFVETLEQAMDSVVVIDAKNDIIFYNRAAENLWGYTKTEVIGQNVKILVPDHIKPNHDRYVNANRDTGKNKIVGTNRDVEIVCKDGSTKWGSMSISKVTVDGENLYTAFVQDVTAAVIERKRVEMLSLVTDKTDNAILITDASWRVVYVNKGFSSILGFESDDVLGRTPISIIAPHFSDNQIAKVHTTLKNGTAIKVDELIQTKSGQKLWCSVMSNPVFNEIGELTHTVTIFSEITKTKLHEVLHARILGAIARDEPLEIIMESACHEVSRIIGDITPAILKVDDNNCLQLLSSSNLPNEYGKLLQDIRIGESVASSGTAAYRGKPVLVTDIENDPLWQEYREKILPFGYKGCWSFPIQGNKKDSIGVIAFYRKDNKPPSLLEIQLVNILAPLCALAIERDKQQENIRHLAYYDSLTTLPNRSMLHAKAEQALREANQNKEHLAVLFLDLDRFKQVNDSLGHPAGDKLLIEVAGRIKQKCVNLDICGRLSGDEFLLIILGKGADELNHFIEELRLFISQPIDVDETKLTPSASIGVSIFPEDGHDIGTLIHRADMAMYQAKIAGKGRFSFFSHELNQLALERQELEVELQKAILNEELELNYQPQIHMKSGKLYGVEALARWNHPKFGAVSPGKFIPLAEECGLIGDLSRWALKTACRQMSVWRNKGIAIPTISVNLSPLNFHNIDLCNLIVSELEHYNLQSSDLTLELTESVLLDTNPSTMQVLHDIHSQGIGFSIDDFGTGYSSLSYLRKIPIKELKLDSSFVSEIEVDGTSQALSRAVLQIGESLKLDVVAEGIESNGQFNILKGQGYHVAQGFLFSKPLNSIEIEAWLKNSQTEIMTPKEEEYVV
ncbi:EAL domain-containing protein [Marinomonas rhizomae]|uniref:Diguanylate cyclase/phosphodiesterase with PAS/PAC sensor(S) n=1 Tax=Marinomonas rhizomae TaxID=491948 RepID=A0A366JBV7_9GAMM|nr:EAL domain-containing protein [Marinomonas rhizomae]RBP83735.1 diguanylate cyclase/phosphodiesterase with PAS/PAC sensor(s) [Marinomonas rhizomae]RNF68368.1 EAL domain-containing protein [Marinomonas rhizomae]